MSSVPGSYPLSGFRVVDLADEKGELAGRILADLGAEVVRVEPPSGARSRRLPPFKDINVNTKATLKKTTSKFCFLDESGKRKRVFFLGLCRLLFGGDVEYVAFNIRERSIRLLLQGQVEKRSETR